MKIVFAIPVLMLLSGCGSSEPQPQNEAVQTSRAIENQTFKTENHSDLFQVANAGQADARSLIDELREELQDPVFLCNGGHGAGAGMTGEEACAFVKGRRAELQRLIRDIDAGAIIIN